jgi:hypothetical protein
MPKKLRTMGFDKSKNTETNRKICLGGVKNIRKDSRKCAHLAVM